MKTTVLSTLAVLAIGCGGSVAPAESTQQTSSSELDSKAPITVALQCMTLGRYDVAGNAVIDTTDGKVWQRDVVPQRLTQPQAIAYCAALELESRRDWRLPQAEELVNIRLLPGLIKGGAGYCVPSIDQVAFPDTPADEFWTATTRPEEQGVYTDFADGRSHYADPTVPLHVRCIHNEDVTAIARHPAPALTY
jgi:hypothetical protein